MKSVFLHPITRVDIEYNLRRALLRRERRNVSENQYQSSLNACAYDYQEMLFRTRDVIQRVGSGCECNRPTDTQIELQEVLQCSCGLNEHLAALIIAYLPSESAPPQLSTEQLFILQQIALGHNVFFSGKAGTGKSFLLRKLLLAKPVRTGIVCTATTGIAAVELKGNTIHAFSGIGMMGECNRDDVVKQVCFVVVFFFCIYIGF